MLGFQGGLLLRHVLWFCWLVVTSFSVGENYCVGVLFYWRMGIFGIIEIFSCCCWVFPIHSGCDTRCLYVLFYIRRLGLMQFIQCLWWRCCWILLYIWNTDTVKAGDSWKVGFCSNPTAKHLDSCRLMTFMSPRFTLLFLTSIIKSMLV